MICFSSILGIDKCICFCVAVFNRSGVKYILRTDIMYRNVSNTHRTADEEKALQLVQEAERKEVYIIIYM